MAIINIGILTGHHYPRLGGMEFANHYLAEALNNMESVSACVACGTMREVPSDFPYPYPCYRANSFSYLTPWLRNRNEQAMIEKENVNILHGPMIHGGGYRSMQWSKKRGIPFVAQSHGSDVQVIPKIGYGESLDPDKKKVIQKVIYSANHLIAVSHINKRDIVELGAHPEKVSVIPNGILYKEIKQVPHYDYRKDWGIHPDDFLLITVGRNRPVKRMELLFETLGKLKNYKQIKCVCIGPKENLGDLALRHGVNKKIILTGRIPGNKVNTLNPPYQELINAYRAANLYVSTSYVESFGSATADALACGIPVVIGKKHGVRDIIDETESGWVMEQETPEELADMIISLYEKRELLRQNTEKIKRSVSWLTWGYVAEEMVNVYKKLL